MYDCLDRRSMICHRCLCADRRKMMQEDGTCEKCAGESKLIGSIRVGYSVNTIIRASLEHTTHEWIPEAEARDRNVKPSWGYVLDRVNTPGADICADPGPVLAWVAALAAKPHEECTDYECDIVAVVRRERVNTPELFALAAGIAHAWRKARKPETPPEPEATGKWLGKIKERMTVPGCQCTKVLALGTNAEHPEWGERWCIKFQAATGEELTWFTGSGGTFDPKEGETYDIKCTPTKHDVYEGRKQTIVSRCAEDKK